MRAAPLLLASFFFATSARAQGKSIEKCTGNFEEAQLKEKRGKLVEAEQLYAACASSQCPAMLRADCAKKRDEMQTRDPTATIVIRDAAGNDVNAKVDVDGKPLGDRTHAQPIDPGEHSVTYVVEGRPPVSQTIAVVEGEKARVITITAKETKDAAPSPQPKPDEGPSIVGPAIVVGIGVIVLGTGVALQLAAGNEDEKAAILLEQAKSPQLTAATRNELVKAGDSRKDAAKNNERLALVVGVSGLLIIAGGVTWYLLSRSSAKKASSFAPLVAPTFVGASWNVSF